jgi:hypothetical protein
MKLYRRKRAKRDNGHLREKAGMFMSGMNHVNTKRMQGTAQRNRKEI